MEQMTIRPVPGPGFVATLLTTTWLDSTEDAGDVAWLFIAHAGPRRNGETTETIETNLLGMVDALQLAPMSETLPDVGARILLRDGAAALHYGHPTTVLRLPRASRRWMSHLALGNASAIALGLDPIPPGTGLDGIEEYLHRSGSAGRVYMGATTVRRRWA
ncbi:hypothetical protein SEA_PICARD_27 [Streptomyces phage Picard]|uniref:Uncharacterized protein n=2 Tax=Picardvirus picard TaxID=2734264 RepID=A0A1J0MC47_9CAUD|nr:hypothetical protein HOR45_gp27 [Streptomyces phage Picard]APD18557.1 hypothetical protein SEA_PICARD_27 [Streptomyces phage Picard]APD18668.1 hypothetical protein SEA_MOJORITA_27 [Streptomyces phage Mojorita]